MTPEEGQKLFDDLFRKLPDEINELYTFLLEKVNQYNTFDLLSYISYYNHIHDTNKYTDYRGDKNFIYSEAIALLCLKNDFVNKTTISEENCLTFFSSIQDAISQYCGKSDMLEIKNSNSDRNILSDISRRLSRENKQVRNPGLPDHHFIFSKELYAPFQNDIENIFGFNILDSINIRRRIPDLINEKVQTTFSSFKDKLNNLFQEINEFKASGINQLKENLNDNKIATYAKLSKNKLKNRIELDLTNELFYSFGHVFSLTANEISDFCGVDLNRVKNFLALFSCKFPALKESDEIYTSISILRTKPFIQHEDRFLIPSIPLMNWAVEEVVEAVIQKEVKLFNKFKDLRHEFLLKQGVSYLRTLLPTAELIESNLFYNIDQDKFETDALIVYDDILFIIEAKSNKINFKAKSGHQLKTEDYLKTIVRDSYSQGIRVLKFIEDSDIAIFKTRHGKKIEINKQNFASIYIISLTLEPIGHLSMAIKATNELGYFKNSHFPWIISLYDLVVIADLIKSPILFIHYLNRRKEFLNQPVFNIFEEIDLLAYFLSDGLYIEHVKEKVKNEKLNWIQYAPETDSINDYYLYYFGYKTKVTPKPKCYLPNSFLNLINELDKSTLASRVSVGLILLEFNSNSINNILHFISKMKNECKKDRQNHSCYTGTDSKEGIGITYMVGMSKQDLDGQLYWSCRHKMEQFNPKIWIGIGDICTEINKYNFKTLVFLKTAT